MSKKKASVMAKERQNFVYGNPEEGVPGCLSNGISEEVANKIYDEMTDFANYAFNKSHAAAYAVVSYQTAFLKYYYPVEFMAALLTSVMDNPGKVAEYILVCRSMGIEILPPDINEGYASFTASGERSIRYGLAAIRSLGDPSIQALITERENGGPYTDIHDFINRAGGRDLNKRAVENLIKAGALDSLPGNRKQKLIVAPDIIDNVMSERKNGIAGQMSLFDIMADKGMERPGYMNFPDLEEYPVELKLAYEKEVLGVYISGHPLQAYEALWKKHITAKTTDFIRDEETGDINVAERSTQTVGGMIADLTARHTKKGEPFAILTLEDPVGSIEVIVWPSEYQKYRDMLEMDAKIFVTGRVRYADESDAGMTATSVTLFEDMPVNLYVRFEDKDDYEDHNRQLMSILNEAPEGPDSVIVYLKQGRQQKKLRIKIIASEALQKLQEAFGDENVAIV